MSVPRISNKEETTAYGHRENKEFLGANPVLFPLPLFERSLKTKELCGWVLNKRMLNQ